jgi:autotransporter-associated beta strand protein
MVQKPDSSASQAWKIADLSAWNPRKVTNDGNMAELGSVGHKIYIAKIRGGRLYYWAGTIIYLKPTHSVTSNQFKNTMNPPKTAHPALFAPAVVLATALLGFTTASAQTPPTPTHTFQPAGASGTFGTVGNWSPGLPGAGNDVLIADGKTANGMTQTEGNTLFGSLTLGVNSTLNLAASNTTGLATNSVLYFNNGSQLNYTSGGTNRANTYNIVSGATVGMHLGQTGGDALPQGSMVGGSNTVVNMTTAILLNMRLNAGSFNGTLNFNTNVANNARAVNFGNASNSLGSGTTNIGTFVRVTGSKSNLMNDSGTLQLTGSSGGASNVKFDMGGSADTIGGLTIDTPINATASAPTYRGSNTLTVSGTTTFQGTAGDVNFDSSNGTPSSHNLITTGSMTFGGTGTWAVSGDGRINLSAASGTRTITANTNASIANTLAGTQGFTKQGASTLTLTGTNGYTGGTTINAGTLAFANGSLGSSGNISFSGSSTLQWASGNTQDLSSRIVMSNSVTSSFNTNGNDVSFASGIGSSTSGALTKAGTGKLTLAANASYTGATTISGGTLEVQGSLASSGITNDSALIYNNGADQSFGNAISGSGTLTKNGAGKLTLSANASYDGSTTISGGTLEVQGSLASSGITNDSTLIYNNASNQSYSGAITGTGSLTKQGAGTLNLTGNNNYGGATTISGGTLEVSGTGDINGSSGITLSGGHFKYNSSTALTAGVTVTSGTVSGTNLAGVSLTVGDGAVISPGNSPGTMNVAGQTWASGGTYDWEILNTTGAAGTGWDLLAGTGTLDITASSGVGNTFVIDLTSLSSISPDVAGNALNFDNTATYAWLIADFAAISGFAANAFEIDASGFTNPLDVNGAFGISLGGVGAVPGDDTQIYLTYTAIPEPGAALIGSLGLLALLRRRR